MNSILQVKLLLADERNKQKPQSRNLRAHAETTTDKIDKLIETLRAVLRYYRSVPKVLNNILVDINYNDIIAKSNRVQALLKPNSRTEPNDIVVGARFSDAPEGQENHIITYYAIFYVDNFIHFICYINIMCYNYNCFAFLLQFF